MSNSLQIVCPHCDAINRLPDNRLNAKPKCGQCKQNLFNGYPVELSSRNFDRHLSKNDIPLLVDFWAPWCGPCKMMVPIFAEVAPKLEPKLRLAKLNTEQEQAIASRYNIRSIPTLALFKNGKEITRQSGVMNAEQLINWVRLHV